MQQSTVETLQKDTRIIVSKVGSFYGDPQTDRFRAFYDRLKSIWKNYDIIGEMDSDLEFFEPITPLLEMAKEKICYVKEPIILGDNSGFDYSKYAFPDSKKVWETIKNEHMINVGMIIGPAKEVYDVLGWISERLKYDNKWGSDQLLFNALIYYYKLFSTQEVDNKWNHPSPHGFITDGKKCFDRSGKEIAVLHKIGTIFTPEEKNIKREDKTPKTFSGVKYSHPPKFK